MKISEFRNAVNSPEHNPAHPVGTAMLLQQLISAHAQNENAFSALFKNGVLTIPHQDVVGTVISFLTPKFENTNESRVALKQQIQILQGQKQWPDLASLASSTNLICSDAHPELGLPPQLYQEGSKKLVEWSGFSRLFNQLANVTGSENLLPAGVMGDLYQTALSTVLLELFKNTHDHATHEISGADIPSSVRGIFAKFYSAESIEKIAVDVPATYPPSAAVSYAKAVVQKIPKRGTANISSGLGANGVLEVSIFDSGPGMAARWAREDATHMTPRTQLDNVLNCLTKGQTSTGASSRGFGLWKVLRSIEEVRGFIRIRTNGVHGFRRFDAKAYRDTAHISNDGERPIPKETLLDWTKGFSPHPSTYPERRGAVVSILIPTGVA